MHRKLARFHLTALLAALAVGIVLAGHGPALAQDGDDNPITDSSSSGGSSSDASFSGGGPGSLGYRMGISTTFPTGGDAVAANLLYGLNPDAFLNLNLGLSFDRFEDPILADNVTVIGLQLGAGYRMYQGPKGRIRPYLEPGVQLVFGDFGNFNDTLEFYAYGNFGVDLAVTDQFTLGAAIGAALGIADSFATIDFGLYTAAINATFWW